jgi:hypothetical protein
MSIKGFHLVFVTVSTLLCLFLMLWSFVITAEVSTVVTTLGVVGLIGSILIPIYGVYFYRKLSRIHF